MMNREEIRDELLGFIRSQVHSPDEIDERTDLIATEMLDSLLVMDLVMFVQTRFGVPLSNREISPNTLRNAAALAAVVQAKQQRGDRAA
jgi:acyl carrier protein